MFECVIPYGLAQLFMLSYLSRCFYGKGFAFLTASQCIVVCWKFGFMYVV